MPNSTLLSNAKISKETLRMFKNSLVIGTVIDWSNSDKFGRGDDQIGVSYRIRRPLQVVGQENDMGWSAANAAVQETSVSLVIDRTLTVPMSFSDADLNLKLEKFSDRVIKKATRYMASKFDASICRSIVNATTGTTAFGGSDQFGATSGTGLVGVANFASFVVGAAGTALTPATVMLAKKYLQDLAIPEDDIYGVLTSGANSELVLAQATLFNTLTVIDKTYRAGFIKEFDGIKFGMSQSLATHVNGAQTSLAVTAGELANGWAETKDLTVTATTQALRSGDMFTVAGVYRVNPITKEQTDTLYQFTVLSANSTGTVDSVTGQTSYASGAVSVVVGPAPILAGPYQNVSATLVGKTITLIGAAGATSQESIIFHKSAIQAVSVGLDVPRGKDMAFAIEGEDIEDFKIRFIREYDSLGVGGVNGTKPAYIARMDAAYGFKTVQPDWICRVRR